MINRFASHRLGMVVMAMAFFVNASCEPGTMLDLEEVGDLINEGGGDCDVDDDGYEKEICGGFDCNDNNPSIHPNAEEECNGTDNDCDGQIDEMLEGPMSELFQGVCAGIMQTCLGTDGWQEPDYALVDGYEDVEQTCDGRDNDCDGEVDEALFGAPIANLQGVCMEARQQCRGEQGFGNPDYGQIERFEIVENSCDGLDNDCDGEVDENLLGPVVEGLLGVCEGAREVCAGEAGFINPDFENILRFEIVENSCDSLDNDCDGEIDELGNECQCFAGDERDCGVAEGVCFLGFQQCTVENIWGQCSGLESLQQELCDGLDNDCDGATDEGLIGAPIANLHGICIGARQECHGEQGFGEPDYEQIEGFEAAEVSCDGLDNDCDGEIDEAFDFMSNTNHCGRCNRVCPEPEEGVNACVEGQCIVGCQGALDCGEGEMCTLLGECISVEQLYIKANNPGLNDSFGLSLAADGDVLAVGAQYEDGDLGSSIRAPNDDGVNAGAVYVYERQLDGSWVLAAYLKGSNTEPFDVFGVSIAVSGNRIVVGARSEDGDATSTNLAPNNDAEQAGAVYVFERVVGGRWDQTAYLKASNAGENDFFGHSVDLDENRLVVGAYYEGGDARSTALVPNNNAEQAGAVYVFEPDASGEWAQVAYLKAGNAEEEDHFGSCVTLDGDRLVVGNANEDGDARSTALVPNNNAEQAGAVYVFEPDASGEWAQVAYLKASNAEEGDLFGSSVALDGDRLAVGAISEDGDFEMMTGRNEGAVYVFERRIDGRWLQTDYLKALNRGPSHQFGKSVELDGNRLFVGAPNEDGDATSTAQAPNNNASDAGAVYLFRLQAGGEWIQETYLKAQNAGRVDFFGSQIVFSEGRTFVSAWAEDGDENSTIEVTNNNVTNSGAVYVLTF